MQRRHPWITLAAASCVCSAAVAGPDDADPVQAPTRLDDNAPAVSEWQRLQDIERSLRDRRARIEEELAHPVWASRLPADHWAHEWAGTYYVGDGLGMNVSLNLSPSEGIVYTWYGCLGLYDGNEGEVTGTFDTDADGEPEGLTVRWEHRRASYRPGRGYDSRRLFFVRWGPEDAEITRRYLVPEAQMDDFVNDFNVGSHARDAQRSAPRLRDPGQPVRRWGEPSPAGAPELPSPWREKLILRTVEASITDVGPEEANAARESMQTISYPVLLDKGSADGLFEGMNLILHGDRSQFEVVTLTAVFEHTSEATIECYVSDGEAVERPQVGDAIRLAEGIPFPEDAEPAADATIAP
ncbi:MAG: hypothetical protein DHS20C14_11710 [Phycisphaeraceae bacterium]|nr:MAG: hypothetical protein DHS20C14_11710 [Phycisphaeraceae bacterium]